MVDLHVHSTFSDGTLTPKQLIDLAKNLGLTCIAITDHDTTAGLCIAAEYAKRSCFSFIPGLEISVDEPRAHLLGYGIDTGYSPLQRALERVAASRSKRNERIVRRLQELGYGITMADVRAQSDEEILGRPHIARALVEKRYFDSTAAVFDQLIGPGRPAYVDRERLTAKEGIALIRNAGGVAVLAHPGLLSTDIREIEDRIRVLTELGLQGIEAVYTEHSDGLTKHLINLASATGLIWTGGTDFHGDNKPDISLGTGRGNVMVPDEVAERLLSLIHSSSSR